MKNIVSREDFLLVKEQQINEGLFGIIKGLFKSIGKLYNKIKGGKELQAIIDKYKQNLENIFAELTKTGQEKTAATKNVKAAVEESKIYEQDAPQVKEPKQEKPTAQQPETKNPQQTNPQPENKNVLDKEQLEAKTETIKKRLKQLGTNFNNEADALKKRFTNKDGTISKKLEYSITLAKNEVQDFIYQKWAEFYQSVGNQDAIKNIQTQRANLAKEIKNQTEALQRMMSDVEQVQFGVGKIYKYTNKEGKVFGIKVKEVDNDGNVVSAETIKGNPINPITSQITDDYYKKGSSYKYTGKQGETEVTILDVSSDGKIQVKSKGGQTFIAPPEKLGFKIKAEKPKEEKPKEENQEIK